VAKDAQRVNFCESENADSPGLGEKSLTRSKRARVASEGRVHR
jgi:hypothetical protein